MDEQTRRSPSSTHTHFFQPRHHSNQEGIGSPRVCTGSGPTCIKVVTHDYEQISAATIAHHTGYGKTRNLQRSPYLSMRNIFVRHRSTISSRGPTSFCAIAVKGHFAFENSCKWLKWGLFIHADIQLICILMFLYPSIFFRKTKQKPRSGNNPVSCSLKSSLRQFAPLTARGH